MASCKRHPSGDVNCEKCKRLQERARRIETLKGSWSL
ncbi:hypothetical protein M199_gp076 [Halogranum tailed virus 1]|uniref:Uncharacterized protein n=1 Tax=Halogranum tailed virus 1 TaxID=1273749 RepID=R4T9I5_9CAUD|nr:hypothetical protein M199_gp076 [Halogranum tailed virus 1]AGM11590.1 hypothetical protein HGTV1_293 [Halogranum tailed virus 1]